MPRYVSNSFIVHEHKPQFRNKIFRKKASSEILSLILAPLKPTTSPQLITLWRPIDHPSHQTRLATPPSQSPSSILQRRVVSWRQTPPIARRPTETANRGTRDASIRTHSIDQARFEIVDYFLTCDAWYDGMGIRLFGSVCQRSSRFFLRTGEAWGKNWWGWFLVGCVLDERDWFFCM